MNRSGVSVLLLGVTLLGCGGSQTGAPSPAPTVPSVAATSEPAPSVSASASAGPSSPVAPPAAEQPLALPWYPVIDGADDAWVLGDAVLVRYGNSLALVKDGKVEKRDDLSRSLGMQMMHPLSRVYGRWPDVVFAEMIGTDGRSGWSELHELKNQRSFAPLANGRLPTHWRLLGASPWTGGAWIGLEHNTMPWGPPPHMRFRTLGAKQAGALPAWPKGTPTEECPIDFSPTSLLAFDSGHIFATANDCSGAAVALVWSPGAKDPRMSTFPGARSADQDAQVLSGRSGTDVVASWVGKTELYVARFNGTSWARVEVPFRENTAISMGPDGALWHSSKDGLFKQEGDAWRQVARFAWQGSDIALQAVYHGPRGDAWALAGSLLLHSEKPAGEVVRLEYEAGQEQRGTVSIPRAADWACQDIFVLMYGITKVTPKNYDFPLTRKALRGHTEFASARFAETEDGGRRYFGAFMDDLRLARKMASIVEKGVQGSKPQVLCVKPRILRNLQIDLRTGNVTSNEPAAP